MAGLVLGIVALTVFLTILAIGLIWHLDKQAERQHEKEKMEHEERQTLFDDEDL